MTREQLMEHVSLQPNGCWNWNGYVTPNGYGRVTSAIGYAHRASYALHIGPIPAGFVVDHLCRNRLCVNPVHLEAVTRRENTLRGDGATAKNSRKQTCLKGHAYTPENTYVDPRGGRHCRTCRREIFRAWESRGRRGVRGGNCGRPARSPERLTKERAWDAVRCAVARGDLERQPCEVCGAEPAEAHHDDYDRPLDVRWLCPSHHRSVHYGSLAVAA